MDFKKLSAEINTYDAARQEIIKLSSDITKKSKKAIFELHRNDFQGSFAKIEMVQELIDQVLLISQENIALSYEGAFRSSLEEFVEAQFFYNYLKSGSIELGDFEFLGFKEVVGGLCDFTGEIVRRARLYVIDGEYGALQNDYDTIYMIMEELLEMNLSSYLRTKFDQLKRNVYTMEQIRYTVSLK